MASQRLSIYLNDHLAGSVAAMELAQRSAGSNRGTALGEMLERLVEELEDDQVALRNAMERLEVRVDHAKLAAAWVAEKLGRFKLNGSLVSYSSLSRLEELELLVLAVEGKRLLWEALTRRHSDGLDLDQLIKRAQSQRRRLERHRLEAAEKAL